MRKIFKDDADRENFLDRLGGILVETSTACYGGALLSNHVHLLLRTGTVPLATVMARLLTGYVVSFNRRHRRHGYLKGQTTLGEMRGRQFSNTRLNSCDFAVFLGRCLTGCIHEEGKRAPVTSFYP
ncbi:MAG TPA: hypothetical protein VMU60_02710 [Syntrophobacteria bacterium]|nr:hypothetical protein [Syntrophobacteria bacterium]